MFPTQVGMNRSSNLAPYEYANVPHAGGDEPPPAAVIRYLTKCSPRRWG